MPPICMPAATPSAGRKKGETTNAPYLAFPTVSRGFRNGDTKLEPHHYHNLPMIFTVTDLFFHTIHFACHRTQATLRALLLHLLGVQRLLCTHHSTLSTLRSLVYFFLQSFKLILKLSRRQLHLHHILQLPVCRYSQFGEGFIDLGTPLSQYYYVSCARNNASVRDFKLGDEGSWHPGLLD